MFTKPQPPRIPDPKGWQGCVKSAAIYAFSLVHYCIVYARARAADSINVRVRLRRRMIASTKSVYCCEQCSLGPIAGLSIYRTSVSLRII